MEYREIEVRFLEIDKAALIEKLRTLGAQDRGEEMLEEVVFYNLADKSWEGGNSKFVRLRTGKAGNTLTYKHRIAQTADGTEEVEFKVDDKQAAEAFLVRLGLAAYRHQQKLRHTFMLGEVVVDIDTWPRIPTYVELEGPSEDALKVAASQLGLDWNNVCFDNARVVIEKHYGIPVGGMTWFTFDRFE